MVCDSRRVLTSFAARSFAKCCDSADWLRLTTASSSPTERSPCTSSHSTTSRLALASCFNKLAAVPALECITRASMLANLVITNIYVNIPLAEARP